MRLVLEETLDLMELNRGFLSGTLIWTTLAMLGEDLHQDANRAG